MNGFRTVRGYQILNQKDKALTPAMEDYLEMIYRCSTEKANISISGISAELNVQAPSTTDMMSRLAELGFIQHEKHGNVQLSETGRQTGRYLYQRHVTIEEFFSRLGVPEEDLLEQTELIEHFICLSTLQCFERFNQHFRDNPKLADILKK